MFIDVKIEEAYLGVGGGHGGLDLLHDVVVLGELLALLIGLAEADTHLLGDVEAQGVHHVAQEEEVDLALAIPVVDVTDVLDLCTGHDQLVSSAQRLPSKAEQREC